VSQVFIAGWHFTCSEDHEWNIPNRSFAMASLPCIIHLSVCNPERTCNCSETNIRPMKVWRKVYDRRRSK